MEKILEREGDIKYGCLMLYFKCGEKKWVNFLENEIDESDIYEEDGFGIEGDPHVTVLYGFHGIDMEEFKKHISNKVIFIKDIKIEDISLFENDEYDVLKLDVTSEKLNKYNKFFRDNYEYTNDYDDYVPHITLAYLNPGAGKKYITEELKDSMISMLNECTDIYYVYSDKNQNKTKFKIVCNKK